MMFRKLLIAAMALVVLAFGLEPDDYNAPKKAVQPGAGSTVSRVIG
jgi:hypothetical protein